MAIPPTINGILLTLMYNPPTAPATIPAQGPAKIPQRNMASWKKCMAEVNSPSWIWMANGGIDMTFAKAAITAVNAKTFVFLILFGLGLV